MEEPSSYPDPNIQNPNPTNLDYTQHDDVQIPPDPLLGSGTFIHVDNPSVQNGNGEATPLPARAPRAGSEAEAVAEPGNTAGVGSTETPASQRKRRQTEDLAERPSWLPESWKMEVRVRTSGATAGTTDRYYVDPVSGRKFRSKNEVTYFLETGSKRKKKSEGDAAASDSPGVNKQKKPKARIGDFSKLNFDFRNAPQKLTWAITSASQDKWMPFSDEGMQTEAVKRDWENAYTSVSQLEGRSRAAH